MNDQVANSRIEQFISRLETLDPGDQARLKRGAGRTMAEARDATILLYRILPDNTPFHQEEIYFLLATLFPLADGKGEGNLGSALNKAQNEKTHKGLDRRLEVLLDSDVDQLSFRLRQTIHFLQSNRIRVNWAQLLRDLLNWDHPTRFVQKNWARAYYTAPKPTTKTKGE